MTDPIQLLLLEIGRDLEKLPGATLNRARPGASAGVEERFKKAFGRLPPPGFAAFLALYDGGVLAPGVQLLSFDESRKRLKEAGRTSDLKGLWPVLDTEGRLFALDADAAGGDGEWPVVEVADRTVDRAGTSFLRFLYSLLADLTVDGAPAAPPGEPVAAIDGVALAQTMAHRDPGLALRWVELADELEGAGRHAEIDAVLAEGLRCAHPVGPALLCMVGLRAHDAGNLAGALAALLDATVLEPVTARDDDARLDAAAALLVLASDGGDAATAARAREILGSSAASTGGYWRGEVMRAWAEERSARASLAMRIVKALLPEDSDIGRMEPPNARLATALRLLIQAREALDHGAPDEAVQKARAAVGERGDLGVCHAMLAEALNAVRERGAVDAAARATELNPALVEAWRELGDAHLEMRQATRAEEAYRQALVRDGSYGLGHAKLAQALLEQGRTIEALEAVNAAGERGGDAFFLSAVRGDVLAEMSRHREAAEAYDQALRMEPDDHWVLHQAALEHGRAGSHDRAEELFERALSSDHEGCHQTLVDYGDLLRRVGRIGDAVRLYRKAVAARPGDPDWRQVLRDAERELMAAPN